MRNQPPLASLRAFEAAARRLSFKAAADELHVTATAISHQIRVLESYCGEALFQRLPRPLSLTPAGTRLYPAVREGFDRFAEGLSQTKARNFGRLRVTATNAFAARCLMPRIPAWRQLANDITLMIIGTDDVLDLGADASDLAIRYARKAPVDGVVSDLSRDSLVGQRIWLSFDVQGLDGVVDGAVEDFCVSEGLMGEIMGFEVAPDGFDVVEFGRVFGQPLDAQPMGARREGGLGRLAGMDRAVVEHDDDGSLALAGFGAGLGAIVMIEFFQKGDEVGAALGFGGGDDQSAVAPVERAHHSDLFGLAGG